MIIHTVKQGDTVFSIGRKYSTSPIKIIENNCLPYPDHLIPGQQLLILVPTRTYIVRGGDTVLKVCRRFGIKKNALLANNPSLHGRSVLHAGTELAIRYNAPLYGSVSMNGYVYEGTSSDRFRTLLPYLTYVTFASFGLKHPWVEESKKEGKIPLLKMKWQDLCSAKEAYALEKIILEAKAAGFSGITLTSPPPDCGQNECIDFLILVKKKLLGTDMLLFQEIEADRKGEYAEVADGIVVMYEKCQKTEIPDFENGEYKTMKEFIKNVDAEKSFLEFSSFGYDGEKALNMLQIHKIALKYKAEIKNDTRKMVSMIDYSSYKNGEKRPLRIHFESLENIKAKLGLMHEFGFIGAAVDIGRVPISYVMMLYSMFSSVECGLYTGIFGI